MYGAILILCWRESIMWFLYFLDLADYIWRCYDRDHLLPPVLSQPKWLKGLKHLWHLLDLLSWHLAWDMLFFRWKKLKGKFKNQGVSQHSWYQDSLSTISSTDLLDKGSGQEVQAMVAVRRKEMGIWTLRKRLHCLKQETVKV